MAETCLTEYNERTDVIVTAVFTDEDGDAVSPSAATYRVDDIASKTSMLAATTISPLASSVELHITSDQNQIVRRGASEIRTVTVEYDYTSATFGAMHATKQYQYRIMNLYGVVTVPSSSQSPSASASPS